MPTDVIDVFDDLPPLESPPNPEGIPVVKAFVPQEMGETPPTLTEV